MHSLASRYIHQHTVEMAKGECTLYELREPNQSWAINGLDRVLKVQSSVRVIILSCPTK